MRVEEELQFMADFYPEIFPTRKHALEHLFCVIGNGYEWVDGELICNDNYKKRYKLIQEVEKAVFRNEKRWIQMSEEVKRFDDKSILKMEYSFEWYPLSLKYSYIFNYPNDIKEDWLRAINETKELLLKDGIDINKIKA